MSNELAGKRALVLAASSGIGLGIAESLSVAGAKVVISSRTSKQLNNLLHITGDLTKAGDAKRIVLEAVEKLGGIDILVTNAGHPVRGNFSDVSMEGWQTSVQGLFLSVVEAVQSALPIMTAQKYGRIIFVTSIAAKEPLSGMTTSSSLRAGVLGLMKTLSIETAPSGITVNALLPGFTSTPGFGTPAHQEKYLPMIPMGKFATPSDHGDLVAFLASDRAKMITGQAISVDGGFLRSY